MCAKVINAIHLRNFPEKIKNQESIFHPTSDNVILFEILSKMIQAFAFYKTLITECTVCKLVLDSLFSTVCTFNSVFFTTYVASPYVGTHALRKLKTTVQSGLLLLTY